MPKRWGIGLVAILAAWSSRPAVAGCEKDTDCKGDRICEAGACVDPAAAPAPAVEEGDAAPAAEEGDAAPAESEDAPADGEEAAAAPAEGEAAPTAAEEDVAWWKRNSRDDEVPRLQDIFDAVPRPTRKKGATTLIYQRAVPLVVADIHDSTAVWGAKLQSGVHFLGISKVHTTPGLEAINAETNGIVYCPVNCTRIQTVGAREDDIQIVYDGPIKDWAGKAADNLSGYVRKFGKAQQSICSFPIMYNHAPPNTWLDEAEVDKVKQAVVTEIKRYCEL